MTQGGESAAAAAEGAKPTEGAAPAATGREWLPEEFRSDPTFEPFKDLSGLAKSYKHAASLVGVDKAEVLRLPKAADAPEWGDVWNKLGRPEKPDGYEFPEGAVPEALAQPLREKAHSLGLSKTQTAELAGWYAEQRAAEMQQLGQQALTTLKAEWGKTFDDQLHAAKKALREVGGEGVMKVLDETGLGNHPEIIKMFAKLGAERGEAGLKGGAQGNMAGALAPAEAQARIAEKQRDPEFMKAYLDKNAPTHAQAVEEMKRLYEFAIPNQPPVRIG
jgi:hypothetical protein